jgi:hypothetical protein
MNTRPTPETDHLESNLGNAAHPVLSSFCRKLERERDEARAESIRWMSIAEGRGRTDDKEQLTTVTAQRDRLAEVVNAATILIAAKGRHNTMLAYEGLRKTLQSLTPDAKP